MQKLVYHSGIESVKPTRQEDGHVTDSVGTAMIEEMSVDGVEKLSMSFSTGGKCGMMA